MGYQLLVFIDIDHFFIDEIVVMGMCDEIYFFGQMRDWDFLL